MSAGCFTPAKGNFTIGAMMPEDYEQCVDIATSAFTTNNPICVHLGIPPDVYRKFVLADITQTAAVDTSLSLVARGPDGAPVAFLFLVVADLFEEIPKEVFEMHDGLQFLKDIIEATYEKALGPSSLGLGSLMRGKTLRCAMGGTIPAAGGKGAGKALRLRAVEVARERGFETLIVEPGHDATRHKWTKYCGGLIRAETQLDDFVPKKSGLSCKGVKGTVAVCEVVVRPSAHNHSVLWPVYLTWLLWVARKTS